MPGEYLDMTVEGALRMAKSNKNTKLRKLLTDNEYAK